MARLWAALCGVLWICRGSELLRGTCCLSDPTWSRSWSQNHHRPETAECPRQYVESSTLRVF
ncbi:hypothetical protein GBAR_LOCUS31576 [Geodia barretti]|uniref:Secreted protein n=1 Tax=Geodia barretti TaxID=519541 RepID=A0AA35U1B4_GEOBA|nr:hypothetical protein GBAR_LOCUS31576 [Geodia barretti]